jgi:hypothetical protein
MSSHGSDQISGGEKRAASPEVTAAAAPAAAAAGSKAKEVYNVRPAHRRNLSKHFCSPRSGVLTRQLGRALRRYQGGQHSALEQDIHPSLL